ncbi:MAG: chitobiase/beta-hexosaminidase C-terminal domain-containing protein, partial [Desulfovibrio sp.]|nr:chitobiase/beta-hexosaminidase C-terminal domain-containing protein [Desulfovibrio sp.]
MRIVVILLFLVVAVACVVVSGILPPYSASDRPVSENESLRETVGYTIRQGKESIQKPRFSPPLHFYSRPVNVTISSGQPDALIYYTIDGSQPTQNSALYADPVPLPFAGDKPCVVVKAVAVVDGQESTVTAHSYFFAPDIQSRYSSYVFSLSTDGENLYGHEEGILVPGKLRADSMLLYPGKGEGEHDANYKGRGREWERPVDVEVFAPDGARLLSHSAGIRVFGGVSRHFAQKSLRLIARRVYEPNSGK